MFFLFRRSSRSATKRGGGSSSALSSYKVVSQGSEIRAATLHTAGLASNMPSVSYDKEELAAGPVESRTSVAATTTVTTLSLKMLNQLDQLDQLDHAVDQVNDAFKNLEDQLPGDHIPVHTANSTADDFQVNAAIGGEASRRCRVNSRVVGNHAGGSSLQINAPIFGKADLTSPPLSWQAPRCSTAKNLWAVDSHCPDYVFKHVPGVELNPA